jgi:hypothetical protein
MNFDTRSDSRLLRLSVAAAGWALLYAAYRAYYGFGGRLAIIGIPSDEGAWRAINLAAAGLLVGASVLPLVLLPLWGRTGPRRVLLGMAWIIAVGCIMHGLVDDVSRVLSLAGVLEIEYPASIWQSVDSRAADIQDLMFNETWFIVEGLLWAAIAWSVLGPSPARRMWVISAGVAIAGLTLIGLLSAFDVIGQFVVGCAHLCSGVGG